MGVAATEILAQRVGQHRDGVEAGQPGRTSLQVGSPPSRTLQPASPRQRSHGATATERGHRHRPRESQPPECPIKVRAVCLERLDEQPYDHVDIRTSGIELTRPIPVLHLLDPESSALGRHHATRDW